ncbi:ROK family transcriptional regulator [Streptacidiphilus sp. P02-A3a]|uniref:ROK family transcriptional regulator n=1 Tax=Streptacidiphilus sp. P02-A3a TaxID=2704468 RepID=UPI0015FD6A63|nr:ROK family transcriptional regulator [Streptacidiphilus sp. P02-A3a]QMU68094.1 ROK family transcriptional regulator [Streptacidiphilus sp. P02-A3a]
MSSGPGGTAQPGTPSLLRAINDRAALELLLDRGPLSRSQLGALTGLSKPTASQLLSRLENAGLVVPVGTTAGRPGPGAQLYEINPEAAFVAGLDVNASRIRVAVADITGTVVAEHRVATPGRQATGAVDRVRDAVDATVASAGLARNLLRQVVIGTPGALDPGTGKLRYAPHLPGWHSRRLLEELTDSLGVPVAVENDVNLAAIAEQRLGAAKGVQDFVLLWVEDGVGAAVVLSGRLHRGHTGGAGEVGYMPLPGAPLVRNVRMENAGGFQQLLGAPAVLALAREHGISVRTAPEAVTAAVAAAGNGDATLLTLLARRLATGLAAIVAVVDPELVLLSGDIPLAGGEELRALVQDELTGLAVPRPRLALSTVQGSPVVAGALQTALATARESVFTTY